MVEDSSIAHTHTLSEICYHVTFLERSNKVVDIIEYPVDLTLDDEVAAYIPVNSESAASQDTLADLAVIPVVGIAENAKVIG